MSLAFFSTSRSQLGRAGDADVEIAVGAEDDAVRAALDEVVLGDLVGELNAGPAGRRAAGLQLAERGENRLSASSPRRARQRQAFAQA